MFRVHPILYTFPVGPLGLWSDKFPKRRRPLDHHRVEFENLANTGQLGLNTWIFDRDPEAISGMRIGASRLSPTKMFLEFQNARRGAGDSPKLRAVRI